jgi:hypothetical protein
VSTSVSSTASTVSTIGIYAQGAPTTFAGLPGSPTDGLRGFITDCLTTTFATAALGGGTNHVPVYYDSALVGWRVG